MKRFAITALALTASLMVAASVQAHGPSSYHYSNKVIVNSHPVSFKTVSPSTFYHGTHHHHWSYTYWDSRYGCYMYWDPYYTCYYYYCVPAASYYPVSYCPYNTYCWQQPVGGVLPAPVVEVPTMKTDFVAKVPGGQGLAPTPPGNAKLPPDLPPPGVPAGPMVPVK
jgi:hypothetical protein